MKFSALLPGRRQSSLFPTPFLLKYMSDSGWEWCGLKWWFWCGLCFGLRWFGLNGWKLFRGLERCGLNRKMGWGGAVRCLKKKSMNGLNPWVSIRTRRSGLVASFPDSPSSAAADA